MGCGVCGVPGALVLLLLCGVRGAECVVQVAGCCCGVQGAWCGLGVNSVCGIHF